MLLPRLPFDRKVTVGLKDVALKAGVQMTDQPIPGLARRNENSQADSGRCLDSFDHGCECARLHPMASGDQGDRVCVNSSYTGNFSNSHLRDQGSCCFVGNHLAVAIFLALEVHHALVIALFPSPRSFLSNVAMNSGNNMTPLQESACEAVTRPSIMPQEFSFRVFAVRPEDISVTLHFKLLRPALWV